MEQCCSARSRVFFCAHRLRSLGHLGQVVGGKRLALARALKAEAQILGKRHDDRHLTRDVQVRCHDLLFSQVAAIERRCNCEGAAIERRCICGIFQKLHALPHGF